MNFLFDCVNLLYRLKESFYSIEDELLYVLYCKHEPNSAGDGSQSHLIYSLRPSARWVEWYLLFAIMLYMPILVQLDSAFIYYILGAFVGFIVLALCKIVAFRRRWRHFAKKRRVGRVGKQVTRHILLVASFLATLIGCGYSSIASSKLPIDLYLFLPFFCGAIILHTGAILLCVISRVSYLNDAKQLNSPWLQGQLRLSCALGMGRKFYPTMCWRSRNDISQVLHRAASANFFFKAGVSNQNTLARFKLPFFMLLLGPAAASLCWLLIYPLIFSLLLDHPMPLSAWMPVLAAQISIWAVLSTGLYFEVSRRLLPAFDKSHPYSFSGMGDIIKEDEVASIFRTIQAMTKGRLLIVFIFAVTVIIPAYLQLMSAVLESK